MQRKIGILMGGLSSEREVSINTGSAVMKACQQLDYNVLILQFQEYLLKLQYHENHHPPAMYYYHRYQT